MSNVYNFSLESSRKLANGLLAYCVFKSDGWYQRIHSFDTRGRRGCDRMVVGLTTYQCNQCLSPLRFWVRIPLTARCSGYNIMW